MTINFSKYQGTGNDFVMIDGRQREIALSKEQISKLCDRKFGIGADGIIILKNKDGYDFEMDYINRDGSRSMCGNGGRCAVQFARQLGIQKQEYHFLAIDGEHIAAIDHVTRWINLKMNDVESVKNAGNDFILDTGSPHYVRIVEDDLRQYKVFDEGRSIRYSDAVAPEGANVNFVKVISDNAIFVRTYERGVEDETLSCGTGVTAAALTFQPHTKGFSIVYVETLGGSLAIEFVKSDDGFTNIRLCGPAECVFNGTINV